VPVIDPDQACLPEPSNRTFVPAVFAVNIKLVGTMAPATGVDGAATAGTTKAAADAKTGAQRSKHRIASSSLVRDRRYGARRAEEIVESHEL
jgi:3'-phosphoadenosine 5'-phosphosulfate (PAPS) 3'-phosphatase